MVLTAGLALGVGAPSVADLSGALLMMVLGRAIRLPSRSVHVLAWLGMTVGLVAVGVRWGTPSLEAIQGAHGVLGLFTGSEFTAAATLLATAGALLGLANHLSHASAGLEERVIQGAGAVVGGLAVAATFFARAGSEGLTIPIGIALGALAFGLAFLLSKTSGKLGAAAAVAGPALAAVGLSLLVSGL